MRIIFKGIKKAGNVDYVGAWFLKAAKYIQGTNIEVAFVSTNSICQGSQVEPLWGTLLDTYGININYAYPSFKWSNKASGVAVVTVIITSFSTVNKEQKFIYYKDDLKKVKNINPYLVEGCNVIVKSQGKHIQL
jgi:hypothetical protein